MGVMGDREGGGEIVGKEKRPRPVARFDTRVQQIRESEKHSRVTQRDPREGKLTESNKHVTWLTMAEAARRCGWPVSIVRKWRDSGRVKFVSASEDSHPRCNADELDEFVDSLTRDSSDV